MRVVAAARQTAPGAKVFCFFFLKKKRFSLLFTKDGLPRRASRGSQ
jgi:hypothetical protein